jgi:hypothetical protein
MKFSKSVVLAFLAVALAPLAVSVLEMDTDVNAGMRQGVQASKVVESGAIAVDTENSVGLIHGQYVAPLTTIAIGSAVKHAARKVTGCEFAARDLLQGRGQVRGFCQ